MATIDAPLATDEFDRFFDLIAPAFAAALERAWADATGRPLTPAEIHTALQDALHDAMGDAIREIYGADAGTLVDGKRPQ
jgi:hypothetical protein